MAQSEGPGIRLGGLAQVGLLAGPFMSMVDSSIVNVALPDIARSLHSPLSTVQWVVSLYLLALGVALPATAYLAKRFGTKRVYGASLVGFTCASALCALSPSVGVLSAWRVVQGIFGAGMVPLAMNMLFGESQSQRQMSPLAGMMLFLAPAIAPAIGGLLIPAAGWPSIFLVNIPVGLVALLGMRRIPPSAEPRMSEKVPAFDLPGFLLLALGIAGITYGTTAAVQQGWLQPDVWPYWACGTVLLVLYGVWAARRPDAIVHPGLLSTPQRVLAMGLNALVSVVTFALVVLVPVWVQEFQGRSAIVAGLVLLPQGVMTGVGAILGNALPGRVGVRATAALGMAILSLSTLGMLAVGIATPPWLTALILSGRGFAIGLVIQPVLNRLLGSLPPAEIPDGNTLFNIFDRIGGATGIALITTYFQTRLRTAGAALAGHAAASPGQRLQLAAVGGFHQTLWLVSVLSILGLLMALALSDRASAQSGTAQMPPGVA